jgi:hypothetical protein
LRQHVRAFRLPILLIAIVIANCGITFASQPLPTTAATLTDSVVGTVALAAADKRPACDSDGPTDPTWKKRHHARRPKAGRLADDGKGNWRRGGSRDSKGPGR